MTQLDEHGERIIAFIKHYQRAYRRSPSYEEIGAALGLTSKDHVSRDLKKLRKLGCLSFTPGVSRSIVLLKDGRKGTVPLPVTNTVAERGPNQTLNSDLTPLDWSRVGRDLVCDEQDVYVLQVRGNSMRDAQLDDGDLVVLNRRDAAQNGEMVAAWLKSKQTMMLRYYHRENGHVRLQPANPSLPSLNVEPSDLEIRGQVLAIVRKTRKS